MANHNVGSKWAEAPVLFARTCPKRTEYTLHFIAIIIRGSFVIKYAHQA